MGWGDERGTRGMSVSLNMQIKDAVHSSLTPRTRACETVRFFSRGIYEVEEDVVDDVVVVVVVVLI